MPRMASLPKLISFAVLIAVFGCLAAQFGAVYGQRGRTTSVAKFRKLKFTTIISGQRKCRLQDRIGQRLFTHKNYCDLAIMVIDPQEIYLDEWAKRTRNVALRYGAPSQRFGVVEGGASGGRIDNATEDTAISETRRFFCAHRAVLAAQSSYFVREINASLAREGPGTTSYLIRHAGPIVIRDIPPVIFEKVLQYLYTFRIDNLEPATEIIDLYVASYLLDLDELRESIGEYMQDMVRSVDTVDKIIHWIDWAEDRIIRSESWGRSRADLIGLRNEMIRVLRRVLSLDNDDRWREFGTHICRLFPQVSATSRTRSNI